MDAHTVETDTTITLIHLMERLWHSAGRPEPGCLIQKVGVVLTRLCEQGNHTPQLFQDAGGANASADTVTGTPPGIVGPAGADTEKHQRLDAPSTSCAPVTAAR